ncbi:MAG: hypothetical protein B5766_02635 [Candidatus Lumbricidophila eiseniae]|uniref:Uncharacterized protein n=1 Tax=Candidatus Lumbricidiphila eiseniae TaxID=1969409 RepID=A0A2A6FTV5_9MICO|nr:MAG: hypothetical protein B5766_02635 [Candidatus Lumbricidophila eiseniae]
MVAGEDPRFYKSFHVRDVRHDLIARPDKNTAKPEAETITFGQRMHETGSIMFGQRMHVSWAFVREALVTRRCRSVLAEP